MRQNMFFHRKWPMEEWDPTLWEILRHRDVLPSVSVAYNKSQRHGTRRGDVMVCVGDCTRGHVSTAYANGNTTYSTQVRLAVGLGA